jgi:hypothetical protein
VPDIAEKLSSSFPIFIAKILLPKVKNFIFLKEIVCDLCQFQKWDFFKSIFSRFLFWIFLQCLAPNIFLQCSVRERRGEKKKEGSKKRF